MTQTLSILLVDAHPVVRVGARSLLEAEPGMYVADEAESGENACRKYIDRPADVVVIDLDLPGIGGLEAIRRIKSRHHEARILVFTGHHETVFVEQSLQAGARGYLGKHCAGAALLEAVSLVGNGGIYIEPDIAQRLAVRKTTGIETPFELLSTREFEIFCLLAEGLSVNQVSIRLSLSSKTVANYATQIKSKLDVHTIAELARMAIRHGIVSI
jgi:two-component system, NarL family, invasion response regulator UvrY